MKYHDGVHLSMPEVKERAALDAPLSLDAASSLDNSALARALAHEASAQIYIGPTVATLAASPMWRLMADELFATVANERVFRMAFLLASARLMLAGCEAERSSE